MKKEGKAEKKQLLKAGYTNSKRLGEIFCVVCFAFLIFFAFVNVWRNSQWSNAWIFCIAFILSMLFSDFVAGLVHWYADTWGTIETPFLGTFIRSFREHHLDPVAICTHDAIETNGDNCLTTLVPLYFMCVKEVTSSWDYFSLCFWAWTCIFVAFTNQFHKWAHTYRPPAVVRFLQDYGIILSRKNHSVHHLNPFDTHYCITNGWLNQPLQYIEFWRVLELSLIHI
eukprot:TRINITY_DN3282_c0_g1_i1.p1 TRINITY_DN3282_c0_g1~~TRINITY_DN3282_c0_g1_i1.p1  ORF type:complete len:226 (-),score=22.89 TRINITY_DN3282_c0_g1_i1:26-703(-)